MASPLIIPEQYSIEEYLYKEVRSEGPNEYFDGRIVERKCVAITQSLVATNIMAAIHTEVHKNEKSPLRVVGSGLLTYIPQLNYIVYPGAALVYQQPQFLTPDQNVLLNPLLTVEIVSASDTEYNHATRFPYYKTVSSYIEHVFIELETPYVIASYKVGENTWNDLVATGLDQSIFLRSINCSIALEYIYRNVEFARRTK